MLGSKAFASEFIAVWAKDPAKGCMLENPRIQSLGNRAFVVGQLADQGTGGDVRIGMTFWFPIEDVLMITEFPNMHKAREYYAEWERRRAAGRE